MYIYIYIYILYIYMIYLSLDRFRMLKVGVRTYLNRIFPETSQNLDEKLVSKINQSHCGDEDEPQTHVTPTFLGKS